MSGTISLGTEAMRELVQKAVFDSFTPETREKLIADAIRKLFSEKVGNYSSETHFERMFADAVRDVARGEVEKAIKDPSGPFYPKLLDAIAQGLERAFEGERHGKLIGHMADAVATAFKPEGRY